MESDCAACMMTITELILSSSIICLWDWIVSSLFCVSSSFFLQTVVDAFNVVFSSIQGRSKSLGPKKQKQARQVVSIIVA